MEKLSCFKAYDVRGRVPEELNEDLAYKIGRAYAAFLRPTKVALGRDIRTSSLPLALALTAGLGDSGVEVWDLGLCGTEQVYFYTSHLKLDGGIMVTASHNPSDYNGLKLVRRESRPVSGDTGLRDLEALAAAGKFPPLAPEPRRPATHRRLRGLRRPPAQLCGFSRAATPESGGQRRQRLRRPGAGPAGATFALPPHQGAPRA